MTALARGGPRLLVLRLSPCLLLLLAAVSGLPPDRSTGPRLHSSEVLRGWGSLQQPAGFEREAPGRGHSGSLQLSGADGEGEERVPQRTLKRRNSLSKNIRLNESPENMRPRTRLGRMRKALSRWFKRLWGGIKSRARKAHNFVRGAASRIHAKIPRLRWRRRRSPEQLQERSREGPQTPGEGPSAGGAVGSLRGTPRSPEERERTTRLRRSLSLPSLHPSRMGMHGVGGFMTKAAEDRQDEDSTTALPSRQSSRKISVSEKAFEAGEAEEAASRGPLPVLPGSRQPSVSESLPSSRRSSVSEPDDEQWFDPVESLDENDEFVDAKSYPPPPEGVAQDEDKKSPAGEEAVAAAVADRKEEPLEEQSVEGGGAAVVSESPELGETEGAAAAAASREGEEPLHTHPTESLDLERTCSMAVASQAMRRNVEQFPDLCGLWEAFTRRGLYVSDAADMEMLAMQLASKLAAAKELPEDDQSPSAAIVKMLERLAKQWNAVKLAEDKALNACWFRQMYELKLAATEEERKLLEELSRKEEHELLTISIKTTAKKLESLRKKVEIQMPICLEALEQEKQTRKELIQLLETERDNMEAVSNRLDLEATTEAKNLKRIHDNLYRLSRLEMCSLKAVFSVEGHTEDMYQLVKDLVRRKWLSWAPPYWWLRAFDIKRKAEGGKYVPSDTSEACEEYLNQLQKNEFDVSPDLLWYFEITRIRE